MKPGELFGDARDPSPTSKNPVVRVEAHFVAKFGERFAGLKPRRSFGHDRKRLKELVAAWGEPTVVALIDDFFASTDRRVERAWNPDYSIRHFSGVAQLLLIARNGHAESDDPVAAANRRAVRDAAGRRGK
jgi:hypothetical protein